MKDTSSYILNNQNPKLIKFILDEINKCTYFRTAILSKLYINKILGIRYRDIEDSLKRSTSNKIGRIISELYKLEIIVRNTEASSSTWKNLYKNKLYKALDEKMEQNYHIIKLK